MHGDWRPTASLALLRQRAELLQRLRAFFQQRDVLEVETPLLSLAAVTDLHLQNLAVDFQGETRFLQTSPEFAMKRLLAAGSGPVFQLCKAFRPDESGRLHNPEFSMLEWYRPDWDDEQLMAEVEALILYCLPEPRRPAAPFPRRSYRDLFLQYLQIDPLEASVEALRACARQHLEVSDLAEDRDAWLQLLFSHCVEPQLSGAVFVTQFPPGQAALAQVQPDAQGRPVARRFELYIDSIELANGYLELTDADEQRRRFEQDNAERLRRGLPAMPIDERLLAALGAGLPPCSGVALGFDRLLLCASGESALSSVLAFPGDHA